MRISDAVVHSEDESEEDHAQMDGTITSELVEAYSQCRRKAFLLLRGDLQCEQHEYDRVIADRAAAAQTRHLSTLHDNQADSIQENQNSAGATPSARITHATSDALEPPRRQRSDAGHEPRLVIGTAKITTEQRLRLAFAGHLVGETSRHRPTHGIIIPFNAAQKRVRIVHLYPGVESTIGILQEWGKSLSADAPPLIFNTHCSRCPFRQLCLKEAERQDNLSLLDRMTPKVIRKYGKRGIFTIDQLSYAYRPRRRRKKPASAPPVFNIELQAMAIRMGKIYLHEAPSLGKHSIELFLDIEGVPDENLDYLIGLDVRESGQVTEYSFWADAASDEVAVFKNCLDVIAKYPDAPIFHYGSYEPRAFARIATKHGIKCNWLTKRLVNVNTAIFGKVYFPTRSNRLKDLGAAIGAKWTVPDATGLHSIAWRWRWDETRDPKYKEQLLAYNRDDCRALRLLTDELQDIPLSGESRPDVYLACAQKRNTTATGAEIHRVLEGFLTSAHHDYQAKRISIRSSSAEELGDAPESRPRRERRAIVPRALPRCVGTVIRVPRKRRCPRHPTQPLAGTDKVAEHSLIDLTFTRNGCRKTIIRYLGTRGYCHLCDFAYPPPTIRRLHGYVFGDRFRAWVVYQHVALRVPYSAIIQATEDMFSEHLPAGTLLNFMSHVSKDHAATESLLLRRILQSPFIHADETKINIKGANQYVWVLTDGSHVIFRLTETRETSLVQSLLGAYQGVLVSDFYGGYDALTCRQQKCLVHLIRDLNDDLWKNPFDREYEEFVGAVRDLFVPIFTDVHKYGVRRRHLHKHRAAVDRFYKSTIDSERREDELIGRYQKRFVRYRDSLFRFLDEDDLPWNNNTAERAIRHLAVQRKISGSFASAGAKEHLRLLGISQSCRFQGKSFLRFLLSGLHDVDAYTQSRRRRRTLGPCTFR